MDSRGHPKIWPLLYLLNWNVWAEAVGERKSESPLFILVGVFFSFFMLVPVKGTELLFNFCNCFHHLSEIVSLKFNFFASVDYVNFFHIPFSSWRIQQLLIQLFFRNDLYLQLLQTVVLDSFSHLPLCYETTSLLWNFQFLWQSHSAPPAIIILLLSLNRYHLLTSGLLACRTWPVEQRE